MLKTILLITLLISSFSIFANEETGNSCIQNFLNRFCITLHPQYEGSKMIIHDKDFNKDYDPIWASGVETIKIGKKGVYILTQSDGRAGAIYLCNPINGRCKFLVSSEQYPGFEKIYDFELMRNSRIKIYLIKTGSNMAYRIFRIQ